MHTTDHEGGSGLWLHCAALQLPRVSSAAACFVLQRGGFILPDVQTFAERLEQPQAANGPVDGTLFVQRRISLHRIV